MYRGSDEAGAESGRIMINQVQGGSRIRQGGGGPVMVQHGGGPTEQRFVQHRPQNFVQHDSPSQHPESFPRHPPANQQQQDVQYLSHSRYASSSQSNSFSPHLNGQQPQRQSIPVNSAPPGSSSQQELRYTQQQHQHRQPAYHSPGVAPSPTSTSFNHPSPHGVPISESHRYSNGQPQPHPQSQQLQQLQPVPRQNAARRASVEQSIATSLPPPSPRSQRQAPYPAPSQQFPQQSRIVHSRSVQGLAPRRIEEEMERELSHRAENTFQHPRNPSEISTRSNASEMDSQQPPYAQQRVRSEAVVVSPSSTAIFHTYVLDYLQRAGFLTTAAAFLSEKPAVFTHPLESGRTYPSTSANAIQHTQRSPTSASHFRSRTSPPSMPLFRSDSGSSPVSPSQQDASNHSTIESTSSTSTTSHFGFDRSKSNGMEEEQPSPGEGKRRELIPAADVEHELENGFLYEWFHVFHDVHSARIKSQGSAQARALVANNSAASTIGKRLRLVPPDQNTVQAQQLGQGPMRTTQQPRAQLIARRPSVSQQPVPAGRAVQVGGVSRQFPVGGGQAPPLIRRNSQQQFFQHQRENQARQQALLERQKLQQIQMDQVELQNQMLNETRQNNSTGLSPTRPAPLAVPGYAPDRLARANETFNNYRASLAANQRAQLNQGSPPNQHHQSFVTSPQPIPDGSRYVLREPISQEMNVKPTLQRTHSQPQVQQVPSHEGLMPPPMAINGSSQPGRPPLVRSASTSIVDEVDTTPEEPITQSTKRRRDSVVSASGLDVREMKKVRSSVDLGSQARKSTPVIKSPLAMETDFSTTSPTIAKTELDESEAPYNSTRAHPVVTLEETEALLATLDQGAGPSSQTDFASNSMMLDELDAGPTMTDAELHAFFAASINAQEASEPLLVGVKNSDPPISIPDTADFDFSEYDSFFGSGAASYDPTTYDLRV